jgi:hypothetical protein
MRAWLTFLLIKSQISLGTYDLSPFAIFTNFIHLFIIGLIIFSHSSVISDWMFVEPHYRTNFFFNLFLIKGCQ